MTKLHQTRSEIASRTLAITLESLITAINKKTKVLYFAYGNNREPEIMQALTGNKNLVGHEATLKRYVLGIQRLNQVPATSLSGLPLSPYEVLKRRWGDSFESYVIKRGKGEAILKDGTKIAIETEILGDNQKIDRLVDGREYNSFLNKQEDFFRVIEIARRECFERQKTKEGALASSKEG